MYRRIPIFRAYPVRLPLAMTQQAAGGEVYPEDEDEAVASTISPHVRNETWNHATMIGATDFPQGQSSSSFPLELFDRKRKLSETAAEANTRQAKRLNMDTGPAQMGTTYGLNLAVVPTEVIQTADTRSKLIKLEDELRAAYVENGGLHAQIRELQEINGQVKSRLRDLQSLLDTVNDFAADILADSSE